MKRGVRLAQLIVLAFLLDAGAAVGQTTGAEETVKPDGTMTQTPALAPAPRNAIYNAVTRQRVRTSALEVLRAVATPVPPSVELQPLPDQAAPGDPRGEALKYAMVEGDIGLVDPIRMRLVNVIRDSARP
jgi:hypothetical protein